MIRRKGEYEVSLRENMRGGSGTVRIEHFWRKDELKGPTRLLARLTLEPGTSIGFHEHADEEEVFVVVHGRARVTDGDVVTEVEEGDTILTGDGAGHAVEALGDVPLELLAVIVQY
ncbi:MAG: cupin domain-containing protein [Kiritimatiellaeota bacterium]|nr:cupin domain-containing protein [Kiritimatiellota bacterium]